MIENQKIRPAQVIGPLGEPLTLDTLPPASTKRWVVRRKAEVVAAAKRWTAHHRRSLRPLWDDAGGIRRLAARN